MRAGRLLFGNQSGSKSNPPRASGEPDVRRLDPPALEWPQNPSVSFKAVGIQLLS
jgi:hypothetical protein